MMEQTARALAEMSAKQAFYTGDSLGSIRTKIEYALADRSPTARKMAEYRNLVGYARGIADNIRDDDQLYASNGIQEKVTELEKLMAQLAERTKPKSKPRAVRLKPPKTNGNVIGRVADALGIYDPSRISQYKALLDEGRRTVSAAMNYKDVSYQKSVRKSLETLSSDLDRLEKMMKTRKKKR